MRRLPSTRFEWIAGLCVAACGSSVAGPLDGSAGTEASVEASPEVGLTDDAESTGSDATIETGGDAGVLDCAWAAGKNCWKTTVAAAFGCLPPATEQGTMSPDGTTCTYPDGTTVTFQPPLTGSLGYDTFTRFTLKSGNTTCLSYATNDAGTGSSTTTQAGTIALAASKATQTETVTCPDGTTYTGSLAALSNCSMAVPGFDEGYGGSGSADGGGVSHGRLTLTMTDTGAAGGTIVFRCAN